MPNEYISTIKLPDDDTTYYIKDSENREETAKKIDNPTTKSDGNFLKYDANQQKWVAAEIPGTGVLSVNAKTGETVVNVDNTDSSNPKVGMNVTTTQGNVTLSKETDGLKANVADAALSIAKTDGLQTALDAKELSANKVTSWQSTPDNTHYPSELLVKTETDNIRAVAEGKTKSYVIAAQSDITGTKGTDDNYTNVTAITGVTIANLKVGDVVLIKELNVPDYWVSKINSTTSIDLNKLETSKVPLEDYVSKAEAGDLAYKDSASGSYTPAGTISTPTITVTPSTATVNSITDVGSLPTWSASVNTEILSFSFSQGSLPTKGDDTTVATGITSATSSQPTFTGTAGTVTVS